MDLGMKYHDTFSDARDAANLSRVAPNLPFMRNLPSTRSAEWFVEAVRIVKVDVGG